MININYQKVAPTIENQIIDQHKKQQRQVLETLQKYEDKISNLNAVQLYGQQKQIAKQLLHLISSFDTSWLRHSSSVISLQLQPTLPSDHGSKSKNQSANYNKQAHYLSQQGANYFYPSLNNNEYKNSSIIGQSQFSTPSFHYRLYNLAAKLRIIIESSGFFLSIFSSLIFVLQKYQNFSLKSINFLILQNQQKQKQFETTAKINKFSNASELINQNNNDLLQFKYQCLQRNKDFLLRGNQKNYNKILYQSLLKLNINQNTNKKGKQNNMFGSEKQKQKYIKQIKQFFIKENELFNIKQQSVINKLNNISCWSCITQLKYNTLLPSANTNFYYIMDQKDSQKLMETKNRNLFQQILCSVLNKGSGEIFMGVSQKQKQEIQQKTVGNKKQQQIESNLSENIQNIVINENQKQYEYIVEGVHIKLRTQEHRKYLMKQFIEKYIKNYIKPQSNSMWQRIFKQNDQLERGKKYIQIQYIPVMKQLNSLAQTKGVFVIRIKIDLKKYKRNKIYYIQEPVDLKTNKKKYRFCRDKNSQSMNIKLEEQQIYEYILKKYSRQKIQQRPIHGANIKCMKINNLQMYQYDNVESKQKQMKQKYEGQKIQCKPKYYQESYQKVQISSEYSPNYFYQKKEQFQFEMSKSSKTNKIPIPINMTMCQTKNIDYGLKTIQNYKNNSILIVSPKGMNEERSLYKQFLKALDSRNITYKCEEIYSKLPKISMRSIFYVNHQQKYDALKDIALALDKQSRNLILADVRKQFDLKNPDFYYKAILQLNNVYKNMFPQSNYKVGAKKVQNPIDKTEFTNYYFIFHTEEQAMFAFVALDFQNIRCKFVNQSKTKQMQEQWVY